MASQAKGCGKCGAPNAPTYQFCVTCGAPLAGTHSLVSSSSSGQFLLVHLRKDGRSERVLLPRELIIGRDNADLTVADDAYLSTRHAAVSDTGGHYVLRDLGSTNGTYVRIRGEFELRPGDLLMIGGQVLRFAV